MLIFVKKVFWKKSISMERDSKSLSSLSLQKENGEKFNFVVVGHQKELDNHFKVMFPNETLLTPAVERKSLENNW